MDAGIGAFIQRAVVKTFGLPHAAPKDELEQPTTSQPDFMIGCWPQSLKDADLRRFHEDLSGTDISEHPNKRARSASRVDCSDSRKGSSMPPSPKQEAALRPLLCSEDTDSQRSPLDTEDKPDQEPHLDQAGSQSLFFDEESSGLQHAHVNLAGASSHSLCPDQVTPQRSVFLEYEDMCEEDQMCTDNLDEDTPLISGPTRILTVNDNGKDRLAMLITDDMVATFNEIKEANEDIAKTVKKLKVAESESRDLSIDIEDAEEKLGDAQDQSDADEIKLELEKLQSKLEKTEKQVNVIKKGMWPFESNLRRSTEEFQNLFGEVLQAASRFGRSSQDAQPLAEETDMEMDSEQHSEQASNDPSDSRCQSRSGCGSESESESESLLLDSEDLLRRSATEDLEQTLWGLLEAQAKFDDRHAEYKRESENYHQLIAMGSITYTRTDFDMYSIQYVQDLTMQLRDAEDRYETAKSQAKALGLSVDPYDDNADDHGYRESQEASVVAKVDRGGIEAWSSKVALAKSSEVLAEDDRTLVDIDEWNPRPVDTTESCSVVDFQGYGGDIKAWQKHCDTLREQSIRMQPENVWRLAPMSMKRRHSI